MNFDKLQIGQLFAKFTRRPAQAETETLADGRWIKTELGYNSGSPEITFALGNGKKINTAEILKSIKDIRGKELRLWIDSSGLRWSDYDHEGHTIRFQKSELDEITFPFKFFEEVSHAEMRDEVCSEIKALQNNGDLSKARLISTLPPEVINLLMKNLNKIPDWALKREVDINSDHDDSKPFGFTSEERLALELVHELLAKRNSLVYLMKICQGNIARMGISEDMLREYVSLTMMVKAEDPSQLEVWGLDTSAVPPVTDLDDFKRRIKERMFAIESTNQSNSENHPFGSQESFALNFVFQPLTKKA